MSAIPEIPVFDGQYQVNELKPVIGEVPAEKKWAFSFKYWDQHKYFGLGGVANTWFVSLLDRLKALSGEYIDTVQQDYLKQKAYRYHPIDWSAKNCPISYDQLTWLPKEVLENQEEFPLIQFHVSKAVGRVVGFFDSEYVFHVVLLDPEHNIQPSSYDDYRVQVCSVLDSEFTTVLHQVDCVLDEFCRKEKCKHIQALEKIPSWRDDMLETNVFLVKATAANVDTYRELLKAGHVKSIDDVFLKGLDFEIESYLEKGA